MDFKIGDRVKFQVRENGYPRWNYNCDLDTGLPLHETAGIVKEVQKDKVITEFNHKGNLTIWEWPLPGHPSYGEDQWNRPGYLSKVGVEAATSGKCTCDLYVMMNVGCKCGAFQRERKCK
jgi:hypothetical protein